MPKKKYEQLMAQEADEREEIRRLDRQVAFRRPVVHEIKHDGFRVIARKDGDRVRLYSRAMT